MFRVLYKAIFRGFINYVHFTSNVLSAIIISPISLYINILRFLYILQIQTFYVTVIYIQRDWTSYDRRNIGCKMNVVYEPPEDGLI
jgi:hypothetical protein